MSDDILSIAPTDPYWQPDRLSGDRALAIVTALAPGAPNGVEVDIDMTWHDTLAIVDCGEYLERITCPHCGGSVDTDWWFGPSRRTRRGRARDPCRPSTVLQHRDLTGCTGL